VRRRLSRWFRTWRWKHGLYSPRDRRGRPVTWRARAVRRWRIWRGHPGSGTILLGRRIRLRHRAAARLRAIASPRHWRWLRSRRQEPPKPLPAWTGAAGERISNRRTYQWVARTPPAAPQPQPRSRPAAQGTGNGTGPGQGAGQEKGKRMDTHAMAEQIREDGKREFDSPQDVHDTLTGMHEVVAAVQETLAHWGEALAEMGTHPRYAEVTAEAAQQMRGIADQMEEVLSGGVMQGPG